MASTVGQIFHWPRSVRQTIATQWYVHPVRIHTSLYQASKKHKKHKGSEPFITQYLKATQLPLEFKDFKGSDPLISMPL